MKYKAIISDIDDTITLPLPHSVPSKSVTSLISAILEKGIPFCLATGRPYKHISHIIKHLSLTSPVITDNGAEIWNTKNNSLLWGAYLNNNDVKDILKIALSFTNFVRISCDIGVFEKTNSIPNNAGKIKKININGISEKKSQLLVKKLEENIKDIAISKAGSWDGKDLLDIYTTNAEATKQHAVLKLAEILHISTQEMIGIGDHYNDFPLLMACGLKVAMGNAVAELKEIADYIAPSVEEDGVVDVIEKFILT